MLRSFPSAPPRPGIESTAYIGRVEQISPPRKIVVPLPPEVQPVADAVGVLLRSEGDEDPLLEEQPRSSPAYSNKTSLPRSPPRPAGEKRRVHPCAASAQARRANRTRVEE